MVVLVVAAALVQPVVLADVKVDVEVLAQFLAKTHVKDLVKEDAVMVALVLLAAFRILFL